MNEQLPRWRDDNVVRVLAVIGLLIVMSLAIKFWPWALGIVLLWWLLRGGVWWWFRAGISAVQRGKGIRRAERVQLIQRCEQQHEAHTRGLPWGTYGEYPPSDLNHGLSRDYRSN